jgi:hypothetical protein
VMRSGINFLAVHKTDRSLTHLMQRPAATG